ncbi:hypothetical protein PMAYCL1PPCAC_30810, partial [Pristionchus mayeri]
IFYSVQMNRLGGIQIQEHPSGADTASEDSLKTPGLRRGLADLGDANTNRTVEMNKTACSARSTNAFTPRNRNNLAPIRTQTSRKPNVFVLEDTASPEKDTAGEHTEMEDEEVDTCATLSFGDRSVFFKSMRNDTTILTGEKFEEGADEEEMEDDNDEGGVERYFKLIYNVAENADEMWNDMEVEVHDSDTEIETCEFVDLKHEERLLLLDEIKERCRLTDIRLVDSDEILALQRKWREEEELDEEDSSFEVDENDQSI